MTPEEATRHAGPMLADDAEERQRPMSGWAVAMWVGVGSLWALAIGAGAVWVWGMVR